MVCGVFMAVCEGQYDVIVGSRGGSSVLLVVLKNDRVIGWSTGSRRSPRCENRWEEQKN
jgi:hypothetical protein